MEQHKVDSRVCEVGVGIDEAGGSSQDKQLPLPVKKTHLRDLQSETALSGQDKQLPVPVNTVLRDLPSETGLSGQNKQLPAPAKKTPLRDLQNENNIIAQKGSDNPLILKEAVITEATKVSGTKRPFPESPMNPHLQSPNGNGANGHLVYVRRKSEAETGRNGNNEVIADSIHSPQPSQLGHQEDAVQQKSLLKESPTRCLSAFSPIPSASVMSIPSGKPSIPVSLGNSEKVTSEEHTVQAVASPMSLPTEARVIKQNWEERYIQLQMYLKKIDQSSLEDHLQVLRSLSAVELSRHAVELEKRAIQLSLEQGKELQRVKTLNVLGKSLKTPNGPPVQQPMPQN